MLSLKSKSQIFISSKYLLLLIIIIGFLLRVYGINWDSGFHLHPDERMLIMVADRLHFFDQLNPNFFNYGSLPIYLLKGLTQFIDTIFGPSFSNYHGMLYAGRLLSILFDCLTICLIYKITRLLFNNKINQTSTFYLLPSFFYAIAFFPIQNSHFFISDVFLTTFTTLLIYLLLKYLNNNFSNDRVKSRIGWIVLIGAVFGAMMATKFTAVIFLPIIIGLIIWKTIKQFSNLAISLFIFNFSFLVFYFVFMPYALIEYKRFLADILAQIRMNSDPYIFPYTLQYVGTTPYLYYLKNMFWWGMGPVISVLSLIGLIQAFRDFRTSCHSRESGNLLDRFRIKCGMTYECILFFIFYLFYFLIIGRSAVKFMRYMLPIYPFLTVLAVYGMSTFLSFRAERGISRGTSNVPATFDCGECEKNFLNKLRDSSLAFGGLRMTGWAVLTLSVLWTFLFINIYSQKHTRIAATEWILKNVPPGSTLAVEHWDDRLPIYGGEKYNFVEMTLYERPDDEIKWQGLNKKLKQANYIILASNRLYVPLQKLSDCKKYKSCYPKTAEYYRKLFASELGFKKVAEFAVYPTFYVPRFTFHVDDQSADESFTVYDHPKVMVFRKKS